jgi:hypothetical protein
VIKKLAFKIVLAELRKIEMFSGHYDALNGNDHFMNGIWTVMEVIADRAGEYNEFEGQFLQAMIESQDKAERSRR